MYLRMLHMDNFVKLNKLKEITDPIYLDHKKPTSTGLFSYEIFGISQYDRQTIWAYIDLGERFLHPLAAINFKKYGSTYENIIYGIKTYRFENGDFVEDPNGETGIDFLYNHYDDIVWRRTPSVSSNERINFLKQGKDRLFITKFPVCPPFYRDINENSNIGIPVINDMYKKVISQCTALKHRGSFSFFSNLTRANVQRTLVDIFNHYVEQLKGKNGLIRRSVMGRSIDYGAWLVLSAPKITGDRYTDMPVNFEYSGYPLAALMSMLSPFVFQGVKEFFENEFTRSGTFRVVTAQGKLTTVTFEDPMSEFSDDFIRGKMAQFINGHSTRFERIRIPKNDGNINGYLSLSGRFSASDNITTRAMTWTDIFFIVTSRIAASKHVVFSRYPIEHFYSLAYPKIRVESTIETVKADIDGVHYDWYPKVIPGTDSSNAFVNTMSPCNVYLSALSADFDGDSCPQRAVFTDEANSEIENFVYDKKNFLNLVGKNIRTTERDFIQLVYSLTKAPEVVALEDPN